MDDVVRASGIWAIDRALKKYDAGQQSYYALGYMVGTVLKNCEQAGLIRTLVDVLLVPLDRADLAYSAYKFYLHAAGEEVQKVSPVQSSQSSPFLPREQSSPYDADVIHTKSLEDLMSGVRRRLPDWKEYVSQDELSEIFGGHKQKFKSSIGYLGELIVRKAVALECDFNPQRFTYQPIDDGASVGSVIFSYEGGAVRASAFGKQLTDYDCLALVEDVPVIFEVKMGAISGLRAQMRRQIGPICRYFETSKLGYVLVRKGGPKLGDVDRDGGRVLPWYCGMDKFRDDVKARLSGQKAKLSLSKPF